MSNRHASKPPHELARNDAQILRMSKEGKTVREIAAVLDVSKSQVHRRLHAAVRAEIAPVAHEYIDIEEGRLDHLWQALQPGIAHREVDAINAAIKLSARRCRLLGLDAPESIDVTHTANLDVTAELVADTLSESLNAAMDASGLPAARVGALTDYARSVATWVLGGREGERPEPPPLPVAIEPWPYEGSISPGAESVPVAGEFLPMPPRPAASDEDVVDVDIVDVADVRAELRALLIAYPGALDG